MRAGSCVNRLHLPLALLVLLFAGVGCSSGGGVSQPVMTGLNGQGGNSPQVIDSGREPGRFDPTGHSLWGFYRIRVDPTRDVTEIVPVRDASIHWNVLKWLEQGPCTTCLKITKAVPSGNGTVLIDIQIKHPFPNPNLTGFDVRGIAMFAGSWQFLTKAVPDRLQGDGELVNADGFTALYNTYTEGEGPDGMQGYVEGKMAHHFYWLATLNGFKRHVSDDPENTRNAFYAGDSVTATYEIDMPDDPLMFEFGYAVDASWATPLVKPVTDPMTDFGPDANCPEPWKIEVSQEPQGGGLSTIGGAVKLTIDVYDWQGKASHLDPTVECYTLLFDIKTATWVMDGAGFSRYEALVPNETYTFQGGNCKILVAVEDNENATAPDWLDLIAYQVVNVMVSGPPILSVDAEPNPQSQGDPVHLFDNGSYDPDGGDLVECEWDLNNDGTFEQSGKDIYYTWDVPGEYDVQFRATDDEGDASTLPYPLPISISEDGIPVSPTDVTPPQLNFLSMDVCVSGNFAYVAGDVNGLHVFDVTNPAHPVWVTLVETLDAAQDVVVSGGYAYVAVDTAGLAVVDIDPPQSAHLVQSVADFTATDVAIWGNHAYVVGENYGMHIVDISSPENAHLVKSLNYPGWEFYALDISVSNGVACIAGEFDGVMLVDVSVPSSPYIIKTVKEFLCATESVVASGGYAYAGDFNLGLLVIDIDPPEDAGIILEVPYTGYCYDMEISGNYLYAAADSLGFHVFDVSQPDSTHFVKSITTLGSAWGVWLDSGYAYVADGPWGLTVVDVDPIETASVVGNADTCGYTEDVAVSGGYAYLADYSGDLTIVDIDPYDTAHIVSTTDIPGYAQAISIAGNYAYVASLSNSLHILDISLPGTATIVKSIPYQAGQARNVSVSDGYAYVTIVEQEYPDKLGSLQIFDIDPPSAAHLVKTLPGTGLPIDIAFSGNYGFLTVTQDEAYLETGFLVILDISTPEQASIANSFTDLGGTRGIAVSGQYAYIGAGGNFNRLYILDISQPLTPVIVSFRQLGSKLESVSVSNGYAYVEGGILYTLDVDPPETMSQVGTVATPGHMSNAVISGDLAYVASGAGGLRILKLW